jgi:hypothetical protein
MTFWHLMTAKDLKNNEWGFGLNIRVEKNAASEVVPVIALTEWIQKHIIGHQLPSTVHGNYSDTVLKNGKVVMKMDIEGAEYIVLPRLVSSGVFCNAIDFAFGEIHPKHEPLNFKQHRSPGPGLQVNIPRKLQRIF